MFMTRVFSNKMFLLAGVALVFGGVPAIFSAQAQAQNGTPSLIITNGPLPQNLRSQLYSSPTRVQDISPSQITGGAYIDGTDTLVTRKVRELQNDLRMIQRNVETLSGSINGVQKDADARSAEYYANIATIQTQLRSGTTPGNPRLVRRVNDAQNNLEDLSQIVSYLNNEATRVAKLASEASFLLETAQSTYSVAGAVEEDHVMLAEVEDQINGTMVLIERLLTKVSEDITRTNTYLATERSNLRTLALAVNNGEMYGRSFSNFAMAPAARSAMVTQASMPADDVGMNGAEIARDMAPMNTTGRRPLVKISFDRNDVDYEQPLYTAVNDALERFPNASFEVVAVNPTAGNAAEVAIETTRARRNAERVMRTLEQMGLPSSRVELTYDESDAAASSEVHVFVR